MHHKVTNFLWTTVTSVLHNQLVHTDFNMFVDEETNVNKSTVFVKLKDISVHIVIELAGHIWVVLDRKEELVLNLWFIIKKWFIYCHLRKHCCRSHDCNNVNHDAERHYMNSNNRVTTAVTTITRALSWDRDVTAADPEGGKGTIPCKSRPRKRWQPMHFIFFAPLPTLSGSIAGGGGEMDLKKTARTTEPGPFCYLICLRLRLHWALSDGASDSVAKTS